MSLFPNIGAVVTDVVVNKTNTAARIYFSDGSSIYVKYEALILDQSRKPTVSVTPSSRVEKHFANLPKKTVTKVITKTIAKPKTVIRDAVVENGESTVTKEALMMAQKRSESRIEALNKQYEVEHPNTEANYKQSTL